MRTFAKCVFALLMAACFSGADWKAFRGDNSNGVSLDDTGPASVENFLWTTPLEGRGLSGPIVIGDRVYLTSSSGVGNDDRLYVSCYRTDDGKQVWQRQFWATGLTVCHPTMCMATPQPASDGQRVFAFYSSNDRACLDLEGNLLWYRGLNYDFPNACNSVGMASSPIVHGQTVIVQLESDSDAFVMGINVETGETRWKLDRPHASNWTSPVLLKGDAPQNDLVMLQSPSGLTAVVPHSGEVVWTHEMRTAAIPSSVISDGHIFVPVGGLAALKFVSHGSAPEAFWRKGNLNPATASPLAYRGKVYIVSSAGVLACVDPNSGEADWRLRLEGSFSSTPVAGGGLLYFAGQKGLVQVVRPEEKKGEIVGKQDLKETLMCTPALSGDALYIRSDKHLWKLGP